jgi:putative addiction module component (TIGR02574 family)
MSRAQDFDFSGWTTHERLELADLLLDSLGVRERPWTPTAAQQAELDRRLAEYDSDPDAGETWEDVRNEIVVERKCTSNPKKERVP